MDEFPIEPTEDEEKYVGAFLSRAYPENVAESRKRKANIKREIGRPTGMLAPGRRDLFGDLSSDRFLFDALREHHVKAVLVVSLRFRWNPASVLALWQNEGLPSPSVRRFEAKAPGPFQDISKWYDGKVPKSEDEASAWARSAILWERWGLDKLAPIIRTAGKDNKLRRNVRKTVHDEAFRLGREQECGSYLAGDPLPYLEGRDKPIELKRAGRKWMFRTHREYQTTMLAIQHSRFLNQIKRIPPAYDTGSATVYTRTVGAAFLYMHFNSRFAERHLEKIAKRLVKKTERKQAEYDGTDLLRFFVSSPIPKEVRDRITKTRTLNSHSYVNSLRFEFLRRVYEVVFRGFLPEILPSLFLLDEL